MALANYVNQTLDDLLEKYKSGVNNSKGHIADDFVRDSFERNIKTYSEIISGMEGFSRLFEGQLDPKVNERLNLVLRDFVIKALKDKYDPSQLYGKILDVYNQEVFSKGNEALVMLLAKMYWEALKILGNQDPITKEYYRGVPKEDREGAAKIIPILEELLGEALYEYWDRKVTKEEIMKNLAKHSLPLYKSWEGVKSKIEGLTPATPVRDAIDDLVKVLEDKYLSFIRGLIVAAYNKRSAPEHIINVLKYLTGKDFFKNAFNEIYNEIGNYINQLQPQIAQYLQQNQPAGQQQGQQANQPNVQQPQQQPAQQANQPQQNQQNNQQGQQTP